MANTKVHKPPSIISFKFYLLQAGLLYFNLFQTKPRGSTILMHNFFLAKTVQTGGQNTGGQDVGRQKNWGPGQEHRNQEPGGQEDGGQEPGCQDALGHVASGMETE